MSQRLVVTRDHRAIDIHAERLGELERRQLPQPAEQAIWPAAREDDLAGVFDPHERALDQRQVGRLLARGDHRQRVLPAGLRGGARGAQRTRQAARLGRRADRRAELHEALVEIAGLGVGRQGAHQLAGRGPQRLAAGGRLDVVLEAEHARQHARDVAVDQRRALAERDRRDRPRGVGPDARHRAQLGRARRQRAAVPRVDCLRPGVQVARARVVAEPGPRREHVVERRRGERRHRREPRHPALPVRDHRRDAGLLQHDLADPDRVRIARPPPRQIALHLHVVADHRGRDRLMPAHPTSYHASPAFSSRSDM